MPVLLIGHCKGDPELVVPAYDRAVPEVSRVSAGRPLSHVCVRSEEGIFCADVWESEEAVRSFLEDEKVAAAMRDSGLPAPTDKQIWEVHRIGWDSH